MCTAVTYKTKDFYFGRTLDHPCSYGEKPHISPRGYNFNFRCTYNTPSKYALLGNALSADGYPLYYDAINDVGLCMAGLNFPKSCQLKLPKNGSNGVAAFEFIPWVLSQNKSVNEAIEKIKNTEILDIPFSRDLPSATLHWIIADSERCVTAEQTDKGLNIYENPVGVLTNEPPFEFQMQNLNNYLNLSPNEEKSRFCENITLTSPSLGMGAFGLPGDYSSPSRFVRCTFTKENSVSGDSEEERVSQFFHILGSVEQVRGCCRLPDGRYEHTVYTVCYNASKGICYYTTYNDRSIRSASFEK